MPNAENQKDIPGATSQLLSESLGLERSLEQFRRINQRAYFIAICAAVEGARMKTKVGTFSIVAGQINDQAVKNSDLANKFEELVQKIQALSQEAVSVRNLELAADLIDKLDRNLFERNCDVQAWATFESIQNALGSEAEEVVQAACDQLRKLVTIYVVYLDSFLIKPDGTVVAAAKNLSALGLNLARTPWFKSTLAGEMTVTDVYFEENVGGNTVAYCAPIKDSAGSVIGVLANFFDWNYALEMVNSGGYGPDTDALVINSSGTVIAAKKPFRCLTDSMAWMTGAERAIEKGVGYSIEKQRNGQSVAIGFCHTKGYNAYKGKKWSGLVIENLKEIPVINHTVLVSTAGAVVPVNTEAEAKREIESELSGRRLIGTMKEIDNLVSEINSNNCEVKLLAVNASIQAGLAGAEGEGFSVIASDVASLAKQSLVFVEGVNTTTSNLRSAVEESGTLRLLDAARDTMSKIDRNLFERYCDIQAWSSFSQFIKLLSEASAAGKSDLALLANIHKIYEVYHDIYLLNTQGTTVATAITHSLIGKDFSDKEWFQEAAKGKTFVSDLYESGSSNDPVITFSAPVVNGTDIVGVIVSRFNCNFLNDILRASIVESGCETYLLNQSNQVIASRTNEDVFRKEYRSLEIPQAESGSGILQYQEGVRQGTSTVGFAASKGYNTYQGQKWNLITLRPNPQVSKVGQLTPAERFKEKLKRKVA